MTGFAGRAAFVIGSAGLLIATAADSIAVLGRHTGFALLGAIEIVQAAIVLIAAASMVSVTLSRGHAAVHILTDRLNPTRKSAFGRIANVLGASIGQFCGNSTLVFFLTWFPSYLAEERGMDWLKSGFAASLPYIAASVGVLLGGYVSDRIIRATGSATLGRKLPIIAGLLMTSTMIGANYVDDNTVVIAIMSLAFFGQGMVNLGWTLISDVAPRSLIGLTGGVFNLCANVAGIITPIVIGFIVQATGSFYGALAYVGALGIVGAAAYIFILGPVERVMVE